MKPILEYLFNDKLPSVIPILIIGHIIDYVIVHGRLPFADLALAIDQGLDTIAAIIEELVADFFDFWRVAWRVDILAISLILFYSLQFWALAVLQKLYPLTFMIVREEVVVCIALATTLFGLGILYFAPSWLIHPDEGERLILERRIQRGGFFNLLIQQHWI